jgi:predicted anti-sigma-YlaC factor YlaD
MGCARLGRLLEAEAGGGLPNLELVAAHLSACPECAMGIDRLAAVLLTGEDVVLTCERVIALFPAYYEVTQVPTPLMSLPAGQRVQVALHLGGCGACREQFAALCEVSRAEEWGEGA